MESYEAYSVLATDLPPLVRRQRKAWLRLEPVKRQYEEADAEDHKIRKAIAALLVLAGIKRGDGVTCLGYDVVHVGRAGETWLSPDKVAAGFIAAGVKKAVVLKVIAASFDAQPDPFWVTVKRSDRWRKRV